MASLSFPLVTFGVVISAVQSSFEVAVELVVSEESDHGFVQEVVLFLWVQHKAKSGYEDMEQL